MAAEPLLSTDLAHWPRTQGKVRDLYDLGERLLIVATDRISAFDWVLPTGIPQKGRLLTQLSLFWLEQLPVPNHLLSTDLATLPQLSQQEREQLSGRSMIVRKATVAPVECVVRGYLAGSGWKEYQQDGTVCGIELPAGFLESDRLPEPIFTPATKATEGHDENISFARMQELVGAEVAEFLREQSLRLYNHGASHAQSCGLILADTKFEWGQIDGTWTLVDEALTPDSSRYWPADQYQPGRSQPSFDKQFVRDWLLHSDWDRNSPPPELPEEIVAQTQAKYIEAYERLTGKIFGESSRNP